MVSDLIFTALISRERERERESERERVRERERERKQGEASMCCYSSSRVKMTTTYTERESNRRLLDMTVGKLIISENNYHVF